ncbi:MAG TPA: polyprenyl synthetase family protein, partial [Bacteroidetes bacterium]|nr:polyprenyl synthetase family protein [Bacteroidota bacterium]
MIELKTSVLVAAAMKMGALLGGASLEDADMLYGFGKNLGIAFQLQDDLLDTYGDPKKFGKKIGGDIVQNKKTYLYLKALQLSRPEQKAVLLRAFGPKTENEQEKIRVVRQVFDALDIKGHTEAAKEKYRKKAFAFLGNVSVECSRKEEMERFARALMLREA